MKRAANELFLYYTPEIPLFHKILAYAKSITDFIHEIDITEMPITELQLEELALDAHYSLEDIIKTEDTIFDNTSAEVIFDDNDWLKILTHNPNLLKYCIAVLGNKTIIVKEPKDILEMKN